MLPSRSGNNRLTVSGQVSTSSSSHSLSSVPDALTCHRQDGQHGGGVSHQSTGGLPVTHTEQACAPASWAQDKFLYLRAVHVPGVLNLATDFLSRQKLRSGEWMLKRHTVDQIWERIGAADVDLFASQESTQCPFGSLSLGIDALAHPWPDMKLYAFPPVKLIPAVLRRVKTCGLHLLLVAPFWPSQTWFQSWSPSTRGRFRSGRTYTVSFGAGSGTHVQRSGSCGHGRL